MTGAVAAAYWSFARTGKMDVIAACNGCLVGLAGITAPAAFVAPWAAVLIGAIAVPFGLATGHIVERVLKVDDAVGAVPVHWSPTRRLTEWRQPCSPPPPARQRRSGEGGRYRPPSPSQAVPGATVPTA